METIEHLFEPYNFSATHCYVFNMRVTARGNLKIEHKLPEYIRQLKGIFVSINSHQELVKIAGIISLNFNGQTLKCYHNAVLVTNVLNDCSHPYPLDEQLKQNSFLQGYYNATASLADAGYLLTVYLHYL